MKSIIKSMSRTDKRAYIVFRLDDMLLKKIEKTFQKLRSDFKLSDNRKYNGEKWLGDFYELNAKDEVFNFTIVIKDDILRLKLKSDLDFIDKFLKLLMKDVEFAECKKPAK